MKTEQIPEFLPDDIYTYANPLNVIVNECKFGYFYTFRTVWRFRTHGGAWYAVAGFILLQLICTIPALAIDLIGILIYHAAKLFWSLLKRFLRPIFFIIGAAFGLFLLYFFIKTGLWRNLFDFLASFI